MQVLEAQITVKGLHPDIESLWDWLRDVPELRGLLREHRGPVPDGTMGAELIIGVVFSAAALARAVTPLVRALLDYREERERQKHADIIVVTGPNGHMELTARRVPPPDLENLLRQVLGGQTPTDPGREQ
jgi:hypothetical protein